MRFPFPYIQSYSWLELGISLPTSQSGSDKTPLLKAIVHHFPWRQALLRWTGCSSVFQNGYFSPFPWWKTEGMFLQYSLWKPGRAPSDKTHKSVGTPGVFNTQTCPYGASSNLFITAWFSTSVQVPMKVSTQVSPPVSCESLYSYVYLSHFGSSYLPYTFTFLIDLKGNVNFSVCSAFYMLE